MSTSALVDYGLASRGRRPVEVSETAMDASQPEEAAGLKPAIAIIEPRHWCGNACATASPRRSRTTTS